ncbi:MAG: Smr/MutS family protein [Wenzhouxiangellaceae bacterium]|nr:Smr/MutS family protein [Wenzhouxiangellaceae bacterium]
MQHDDEDDKLFRNHVGAVRPLRSSRVAVPPTRVAPAPRMREADERQVIDDLDRARPHGEHFDTGEELGWTRPGLQRRVLMRLRRGHWQVQDELDLHQMNTEAARSSIRSFLDDALANGRRCVKIIHGKGLRSGPGGPRLKQLTARMLSHHPRVLAFASAPPSDGGTGAVYVLVKA